MGDPRYLCSMFLRKKRNNSGSTSVQILSKDKGRRQRLVETIGCGRTEQEIELLIAKGRDRMDYLRGPMLPGLDEDEEVTDKFVRELSNSQVQVIGPELVFGSMYDYIGYNRISNKMFRHMVVCRLYNPGSKLRTVDYMERYLHVSYSVDQIYRFLDNLCSRTEEKSKKDKEKRMDYKQLVEQISYEHTRKTVGGEISVCFYDMTTLYFEASQEDDLRKCGFSKDGKHNCPQIFLGLLVASGGNPIGYEVYEGNISEGATLVPLIKALAGRFGFEKPVVVADAGLLSKRNIVQLSENGYRYILGARPKSESAKIKSTILGLGMKDGDIMEIDKGEGVRMVLSRTEKRSRKDARQREKGLQRLQKRIRGGKLTKEYINNRGYNKYLQIEGNATISIDMEKYEADAAWDGIKGYVTNTDLCAKDVISAYGNLWYIERAFRLNKFDLAVRPIYHRLRNRIEGHICICFTAYTILLELERILCNGKSSITINRAQELTKNMYAINYIQEKSRLLTRVILGMDDEQKELCNLVNAAVKQEPKNG